MLNRFYDIADGKIRYDGININKIKKADLRRSLGVVLQDANLFTGTVMENLRYGNPNATDEECVAAAKLANADGFIRMLPQGYDTVIGERGVRLSGGQKQLLAFGSVYAMGPEVFVLDEPTANLDQDAIARLHDQIACLKHQGRTVVIAEHRLYFLTDLIDRALYLRDGVLERTFTREQFCGLTEQEREELGLRTLTPAACTLPAVAPAGTKEGLSVEGLTCAYRKEPAVFQDLSFSARPGEVVAITGPNGVGKTTLSRCLCGLIREQAGQIRRDGRHLNRKERQKAAFCVMQDVNHQLFSDSVWGECRMSAPDAPDSTVEEVLDSLHLLPFRERHPMSLSGGEKQRVAIGSAIASDKKVLIFDEPTSGLDFKNMMRISEHLKALAQKGKTILIITHDYEFAAMTCNRVLHFVDEGHAETFPLQGNLPRLYSCLMCQ